MTTALTTTTTTAIITTNGLDASILAGQLAPASIAMYRRDFTAYTTWANAEGLPPTSPATFARFRAYLASETAYSPNTVNRMLSAVKRVMAEGATQGYIDADTAKMFAAVDGVKPSAMRERMKAGNGRHRIEPEDMRCILNKPDTATLVGKRDAALLATLASSGLRVSELVSLNVGNLQVTKHRGKDGYLLIGIMGKGQSEPRDAYLSSEAYAKIMAWLDARPVMSQYLFTSMNDGTKGNVTEPGDKPMTPEGAWKLVQRYARRCGLDHISVHDFRRFVGTQLAAKDIRKAQKALGHKSIETTARHYVLDRLVPGETDNLC